MFKLSEKCQGGPICTTRHNFLYYQLKICQYHNHHYDDNQLTTADHLVNTHLSTFLLKLDARHLMLNCKSSLMHDIETSPGPAPTRTFKILTLNCRGLGNIDKTRLLLNKIYQLANKEPVVALLQEMMITRDDYISLAWRGKYVFTPGTGNSKG